MLTQAPFSAIPASFPVITLPFNYFHSPCGAVITTSGSNNSNTGAWTTGNTAVAFPFWIYEDATVYKIGWVNGSSAGGNTDVGIYNSSWSRLVSTGSTLRSGNSIPQWVDVADTALTANTLYYLAANHSQTNANNVTGVLAAANTVNALVLAGIKQMAVGATALPATFTPATISVARTIPKVYLAFHPAGA